MGQRLRHKDMTMQASEIFDTYLALCNGTHLCEVDADANFVDVVNSRNDYGRVLIIPATDECPVAVYSDGGHDLWSVWKVDVDEHDVLVMAHLRPAQEQISRVLSWHLESMDDAPPPDERSAPYVLLQSLLRPRHISARPVWGGAGAYEGCAGWLLQEGDEVVGCVHRTHDGAICVAFGADEHLI